MMHCLNLNDPTISNIISRIGYLTTSNIITHNGIEILDIVKQQPFLDLKEEIKKSYQYQLNTKEFNQSIDDMVEISFWRIFTPSFYDWFGNWMIQYKLQNNLSLGEKEQDVLSTKYQGSYDNLKADISKVVTEDGLPKLVYHSSLYDFPIFKNRDYIHFGTLKAAEDRLDVMIGRLPFTNDNQFSSILEEQLSNISSQPNAIAGITIKPYFLNIKKVIVSEDVIAGWTGKVLLDELNSGIEYKNELEDKSSISYAIRDINQTKSAILPSEDMSALLVKNLVEELKVTPEQAKPLIPTKFLNPTDSKIIYFQRLNDSTYGFVTPDGKVFIDKSTQSLNTPFHEFYHIYDKIILSNYSFDERAKSIIDKLNELVVEGGYLDKVKKLDAYKDDNDEQQLAEARAMLIGDAASSKINEAEHGFLMKLKSLLKDLVDYILDLIGTKSFKDFTPEQILTLSMDRFVEVMIRDMMFDKSFDTKKNIELTSEQRKNIQKLKQLEPEYAKGTDEQVQKFIESIYPDSKVKDIVYHGGKKGIAKYDKEYIGKNEQSFTKAFYFNSDANEANNYRFYKGNSITSSFPIQNYKIGNQYYFFPFGTPNELIHDGKIYSLSTAGIKEEYKVKRVISSDQSKALNKRFAGKDFAYYEPSDFNINTTYDDYVDAVKRTYSDTNDIKIKEVLEYIISDEFIALKDKGVTESIKLRDIPLDLQTRIIEENGAIKIDEEYQTTENTTTVYPNIIDVQHPFIVIDDTEYLKNKRLIEQLSEIGYDISDINENQDFYGYLIDSKKYETFTDFLKNKGYDSFIIQRKNDIEYQIFESERITILNSPETIQKWNKFLNKNNTQFQNNEISDDRKKQVEELFDSNPEIVNQVYSVLGYKTEAAKRVEKANEDIKEIHKIGVDTEYEDVVKNSDKNRFHFLDTNTFTDKNQKSVNIEHVRVPEKYRNKGYGLSMYIVRGEELLKEGKFLISYDLHSPEAEIVWRRLLQLGLATRAGEYGTYQYVGLKNQEITSEQEQQAIQLYSQYLESLNKPNTNPILQDNQQEQVKKFAELQERLSNKEFLEGAKFVFESSEELQQQAYKALGFKETITQDDKSYYRGQVEKPTIDKDGNLILIGINDELYQKAGLPSLGVSMTDDLNSATEYGIGQLEVAKNIASTENIGIDLENELDRLDENGYYLIQIPKNISYEIVKEAGEVKVIGDKIIIPKGQYKIEQVIEGVDNITPQQKQQAIDLYTDYIARVSLGIIKNPSSGEFNESQVKDIVYRGLSNKSDNTIKEDTYWTIEKSLAYDYIERQKSSWENGLLDMYDNPEEIPKELWKSFKAVLQMAIIDVQKPFLDKEGVFSLSKKEGYDSSIGNVKDVMGMEPQILIYQPKQIYQLGSKQDIEGFKEFISKNQNVQLQTDSNLIPTQQSETYDYVFEKLFENFKPYVTELTTDRKRAQEILNGYDTIQYQDKKIGKGELKIDMAEKINDINRNKEIENQIKQFNNDDANSYWSLSTNEEEIKRILKFKYPLLDFVIINEYLDLDNFDNSQVLKAKIKVEPYKNIFYGQTHANLHLDIFQIEDVESEHIVKSLDSLLNKTDDTMPIYINDRIYYRINDSIFKSGPIRLQYNNFDIISDSEFDRLKEITDIAFEEISSDDFLYLDDMLYYMENNIADDLNQQTRGKIALLKDIKEKSPVEYYSILAKYLINSLPSLYDESFSFGSYSQSNTYNPQNDALSYSIEYRNYIPVLLHELMHNFQTSDTAHTRREEEFINKITELYKMAVGQVLDNYFDLPFDYYRNYSEVVGKDGKSYYGLVNINEFIAESMTNPEFQRYLSTIKTNNGKSVFEEIYDAVVKLIKSLLNEDISTESNLLIDTIDTIVDFMEKHNIHENVGKELMWDRWKVDIINKDPSMTYNIWQSLTNKEKLQIINCL